LSQGLEVGLPIHLHQNSAAHTLGRNEIPRPCSSPPCSWSKAPGFPIALEGFS
jgi:hypothetical protein